MSTTRITDNDYADVALYDKVNAIADEIDSELNGKANSSNVVTTDTAQTITAVKTFTADIKRIVDIDVKTTPDGNVYILPFTVDNEDQSLIAYQQIAHLRTGTLQNTIGLRRNINGKIIFNTIDLGIDSAGNKTAYITTPESTSNGLNIATTNFVNNFVNIGDIDNGYIYIGKLLIQWGYFDVVDYSGTLTFKKPFLNTNYNIVASETFKTISSSEYYFNITISNKTTSNAKINLTTKTGSVGWIAIGKGK